MKEIARNSQKKQNEVFMFARAHLYFLSHKLNNITNNPRIYQDFVKAVRLLETTNLTSASHNPKKDQCHLILHAINSKSLALRCRPFVVLDTALGGVHSKKTPAGLLYVKCWEPGATA
jgi:hypothetical protein